MDISSTIPASVNTAENKYKAIVENSLHAFFLTIPDQTILEVNHAATVIFGYTKEEFLELKGEQIIIMDDQRMLSAREQIKKNGFVTSEATGIRKNGERFPVEFSSSFFKDRNGGLRASTMLTDISERNKIKLAVEESDQRYKMFLKHTTEGIWRVALDKPMPVTTPLEEMIATCYEHAYVAECNDTFAVMYGYKNAAKMIGLPLQVLVPKKNPINLEYLTNFFTNGFKVTEQVSYEHDKDDNQLIYVNNMVGIVEEGHIQTAWGIQRDITTGKKAEQALAESENRLRTIVNSEPECIKLLTGDGELLEMNPAGLAMIEADNLKQVIGRKIAEIVIPEHREAFIKLHKDVFNGGIPGKLQFVITGLKGTQRYLETHAVPLKNLDGEISAVLGITRDITENKNAEALLLASEERYRYLFNNNPESIYIWDLDTFKIIEVNESCVELYGYSRKKFLQLSALDLCGKEDHEKFLDIANQVLENKSINKTLTVRQLDSKGAVIIVEASWHIIVYNGKRAVLIIGKNVTEKLLLENSLAEERQIRQQQITDAVITGQEKERSQLGEELHDNINQILATTRLYIECALSENNPRLDLVKESKILLEKAMYEIRKLSKTLMPPSLGEIGLLDALHELTENIKEVNTLQIENDWGNFQETLLNEKLKLTIFRIVQEQLNNVCKHAQANKVTIRLQKINKTICLDINDDGIGFNTTAKRTGLGLRNMISRAEVNNGTVVINSQPGAGCELRATFTVDETLPG